MLAPCSSSRHMNDQRAAAGGVLCCPSQLKRKLTCRVSRVAAAMQSGYHPRQSSLESVVCCRLFQESCGYFHDLNCVQSTLNLETRPAVYPHPSANASQSASGASAGGSSGACGSRHDRFVQTESTCISGGGGLQRSYKDEFLRSLAEIEGLKMKITTMGLELKKLKDQQQPQQQQSTTAQVCHRGCEERLSKLRSALQAREVAVLERDLQCYEAQEQLEVWRRRVRELEMSVVAGRQNFAMKCVALEQLQADTAVRVLSLIVDRAPRGCMRAGGHTTGLEAQVSRWREVSGQLTELSRSTLKFYTRQLRALEEGRLHLTDCPPLPPDSATLTVEKGRDLAECVGQFMHQLKHVCQGRTHEQEGESRDCWESSHRSPPSPRTTNSLLDFPPPAAAAAADTNPANDNSCLSSNHSHPPSKTCLKNAVVNSDQPILAVRKLMAAAAAAASFSPNHNRGIWDEAQVANLFRAHNITACTHNANTSNTTTSNTNINTPVSSTSANLALTHAHSIVQPSPAINTSHSDSCSLPRPGRSRAKQNPPTSREQNPPTGGDGRNESPKKCLCDQCGEPLANVLTTQPGCNHVFHPKCVAKFTKCPACAKIFVLNAL